MANGRRRRRLCYQFINKQNDSDDNKGRDIGGSIELPQDPGPRTETKTEPKLKTQTETHIHAPLLTKRSGSAFTRCNLDFESPVAVYRQFVIHRTAKHTIITF